MPRDPSVPDRVGGVMNRMEPSRGDRVSDFILRIAERRQLPRRYDAMLRRRQSRQSMVTSSFFAHTTNKGEVSGVRPLLFEELHLGNVCSLG